MKISIVSTSDGRGGGYAAAYRLHQGLKLIGLDSQMIVQNKISDDYTVLGANNKLAKSWAKIAPTVNTLPRFFYPQRQQTPFGVQLFPNNIHQKINALKPDIVNLHWICGGFIPIQSLSKINAPLVWSLHDMWAFTGGCHYAGDCQKYLKSCGSCPQLGSKSNGDLSRRIWLQKQHSWKNISITIVALSNWLADCAKNSSLFHDLPIQVIPNGLDIQLYKPIEKNLARNLLNLPQDKQLLLFGAMNATSDKRKGFQFLFPALEKLNQTQKDNIELVVFGASQPVNPPNLGFKVNYLGRLNDNISMVLAYSASDVFVAPSLEDNLPNTVMESIACGNPCVAFNIGGMPDMIEHLQNGYLAQPFEVNDLAKGINWVLEDQERYRKLCDRSREKALNEFSLELQAQRYFYLYQKVCKI